jgi:hypothetical protein
MTTKAKKRLGCHFATGGCAANEKKVSKQKRRANSGTTLWQDVVWAWAGSSLRTRLGQLYGVVFSLIEESAINVGAGTID